MNRNLVNPSYNESDNMKMVWGSSWKAPDKLSDNRTQNNYAKGHFWTYPVIQLYFSGDLWRHCITYFQRKWLLKLIFIILSRYISWRYCSFHTNFFNFLVKMKFFLIITFIFSTINAFDPDAFGYVVSLIQVY